MPWSQSVWRLNPRRRARVDSRELRLEPPHSCRSSFCADAQSRSDVLRFVVGEERVQVGNLLGRKLGLQKSDEFLAIDGLEGIWPRVGNSLQCGPVKINDFSILSLLGKGGGPLGRSQYLCFFGDRFEIRGAAATEVSPYAPNGIPRARGDARKPFRRLPARGGSH